MLPSVPIINYLLSALIGAIIAFLGAMAAESRRREFELKKEAYSAFLKLDTGRPVTPNEWKQNTIFARHCIELWGSEKIKRIVTSILDEQDSGEANRQRFSDRLNTEFIPAIRDDIRATVNPLNRLKSWVRL